LFFFFQAEDGIRDGHVTGVQTCALPILQRQLETQMQQLKNAALLDVRNTYIALTQDRAQVEAASKARELQQQTFDAEQKKYQLEIGRASCRERVKMAGGAGRRTEEHEDG